jgi:hypothetical protein
LFDAGGLEIGRQFLRPLDIRSPRALVAAARQEDEDLALLSEIDAVARTKVDPQFREPFANRLHVAHQPRRSTHDALGDLGRCLGVPKRLEPLGKHLGLTDSDHMLTTVNDLPCVDRSSE